MDEVKAVGTMPAGIKWPHVKAQQASSSTESTAAAVPAAATLHTTAELHSLIFQAKNAGIDVNVIVTEKGSTTIELWRTFSLYEALVFVATINMLNTSVCVHASHS